jgi:hypothetical protein
MAEAYRAAQEVAFAASRAKFEELTGVLSSPDSQMWQHSALENFLDTEGRELLRVVAQDYLTLRGEAEGDWGREGAVVGADGVVRGIERDGTGRNLMLKVGMVRVTRRAHERRDGGRLCPLDAELNLPPELYSHGVRKRVAVEASKSSFDETVQDLGETTGAKIGKRQAEQLVARAAQDFVEFYDQREAPAAEGPILVISADGKGVPVRQEDLRPETRAEAKRRKAAAKDPRGDTDEKRKASKRMATVAAVYTIDRFVRTAADVASEFRGIEDAAKRVKRPKPQHKRVWASVIDTASEVIGSAMLEATRRDPARTKEWVALVDGNEHQLDCLEAQVASEGVELCIILDLVHVLDYLWDAGKDLCGSDEAARRAWVGIRLDRLLKGRVSEVAAGMRRSATKRGLRPQERSNVDACADYLLKYQNYLRYDLYLARGFPIASGVIEGACRHLVKDRMELTGARWRLPCAEAVLRLRALRSSNDFEEYWSFHLDREHRRNHLAHYAAAIPKLVRPQSPRSRRCLTLVK